MRPRLRLLLLGFLAVALPASAATRLTYDMGGGRTVTVAWPVSAFPLKFAIDSRLAGSIPTAKQLVENAEGEWSSVPDSIVTFAPLAVESGLHAGIDRRNTITVADGLFADQKCLAFTTPVHDDAGNLIDADIQIDASLPTSNYNLQELVAHELGHALGLDHSAVLSATMYPWIAPNVTTPLDSDDRIAIATIYPRSETGATLQGHISGVDGAIFAAQVVAVNADGAPVATGLSDQNGDFLLKGVPAGDYRVYAEPLDGPVAINNLTGIWRSAKGTPFPTQFAADGQPLHVESGRIYGNLTVTTQGAVTLNPQTIGLAAAGSPDLKLSASPVSVHAGMTTQIAVGGAGLGSGTTFEVLNPSFHRTGDFTYGPSYAEATFRIDPGVTAGSAVILVHAGHDLAALTGALRIEGGGLAHPRAAGK